VEVHRQRLGTVVSDVLKGCAVLLLVPSRPGYHRGTRNMQGAIQIQRQTPLGGSLVRPAVAAIYSYLSLLARPGAARFTRHVMYFPPALPRMHQLF